MPRTPYNTPALVEQRRQWKRDATKRRQTEKRALAFRIATYRWRLVKGLDDGVSLYQCLSCKGEWTSTGHHTTCRFNYCLNCGIRFLGQIPDNDVQADKSWNRQRLRHRPAPRPSFKIESIAFCGRVARVIKTNPWSDYAQIKASIVWARKDAVATDYSGPGEGVVRPGTVKISIVTD